MKFLVDNQLSPALARFIQDELGELAMHVADVGLQDASDDVVWQYATANDLIVHF